MFFTKQENKKETFQMVDDFIGFSPRRTLSKFKIQRPNLEMKMLSLVFIRISLKA